MDKPGSMSSPSFSFGSDGSESKEAPQISRQQLSQLYQMRVMYEMTTSATSQCFDTCVGRLSPRMEESEKNCIANCAANFMHMKLLFSRRLVDTIKSYQAE